MITTSKQKSLSKKAAWYQINIAIRIMKSSRALTDDFWANDILWQLSVFAYKISLIMRQKKNKFKQQEHCSFIDWFIAMPARIIRSGHQIELKCMSTIISKTLGKILTASSKQHKNRERRKI